MLVEDVRLLEAEYFSNHSEMVIPKLLCEYYNEEKYELVYYFANKYLKQFGEAEFYLIMSFIELKYFTIADEVYQKRKGDWYNLCKQHGIYWKHVVLFALYFKDFDISDYYWAEFGNYYDETIVQLVELAQEESLEQLKKTDIFINVSQRYPLLNDLWKTEKSQEKKVMTFENMQWSIWKKYNEKVKKGGKYAIELLYDEESLKIYSYKPTQIAAAMHILTDGITTIVLDCGCEIAENDTMRIPVNEIFSYLGISDIDAVFISHAHMDHYGSLNELRRRNIVMTQRTRQLIRFSSPQVALDSVSILECFSDYEVNGVHIVFVPNGHIIGSVMMNIDWKKQQRIVYTGDYTVESQRTVPGFCIDDLLEMSNKRIDILLTETTYGNKPGMLKLNEYEKIFAQLCQKQYEYGNKVIIPCFAIGRVQEVALLLSDMAKETGAKILIDGMASKITEYYQLTIGQDILSKNISICTSDCDYSEKIMNNDIILASSGMMKEGSASAKYMEELIEKQNVCVLKVGFIHQNEHMLMSIVNRKEKNINYMDIPLSAHAGYQSLVSTTERISPDYAIYVHGGGITR